MTMPRGLSSFASVPLLLSVDVLARRSSTSRPRSRSSPPLSLLPATASATALALSPRPVKRRVASRRVLIPCLPPFSRPACP